MNTVLVAGVETVAGANLAARLADEFHVLALTLNHPDKTVIENCDSACCPVENAQSIAHWMNAVQPQRVIYCGDAARTSWGDDLNVPLEQQRAILPAEWAKACHEFDSTFTYLSTDAVFSGPWMFHDEQSQCFCTTDKAATFRQMENDVLEQHPDALVVRTNVFGWSPGTEPGWLETTLTEIANRTAGPFSSSRYATPIPASWLAELIARSWAEEITGVFHIAGSERVSEFQLINKLAMEFGLTPVLNAVSEVVERPQGFGQGETSLHCSRVRKALFVPMPTVSESVARIHEEMENGFRARIQPERGARSLQPWESEFATARIA